MITYTLLIPISQGSDEIRELEFIRPKVKHLKKLDAVSGDIAKTAKMIEVCANIPPSVVDEIDSSDLVEIGKIVQNFF